MNVVLVVFDTLRRDCVGAYGTPGWWPVGTPNLDAFAAESPRFTRAYPESLPTLPARRALYTGLRTYPFHGGDFRLKGDFVPAPGWGPIPETQHTLAEILHAAGWRTALVSDLYHEFRPSKNFWRGFAQWVVDVPLLVRHLEGRRAGEHTDLVVQHHDVAAFLLDIAGVQPPVPLDGRSFRDAIWNGGPPIRDHAVVAWGDAVTVVRDPDFLLTLAAETRDAPGCSAVCARD